MTSTGNRQVNSLVWERTTTPALIIIVYLFIEGLGGSPDLLRSALQHRSFTC